MVMLFISPGTVIITAAGEVADLSKTVSPNLKSEIGSQIIYIDLSQSELALGGSSLGQIINQLGDARPNHR